jgi:hypothetical protein
LEAIFIKEKAIRMNCPTHYKSGLAIIIQNRSPIAGIKKSSDKKTQQGFCNRMKTVCPSNALPQIFINQTM